MKMETQHFKPMRCSKSSSKREVYSDTVLQDTKKTQINNLTYHLKELYKEDKQSPKSEEEK